MTPVTMAAELGARIDWSLPALRRSAAARAWAQGDAERAVRLWIRDVRTRRLPRWPFSADYIERVHNAATPAYRLAARENLKALNYRGEDNYGRICCLPVLSAEDLFVAATEETFASLAGDIVNQRDHWGKWGCQTLYRLFQLIQAAVPLKTCPDEFFIPALAWMAKEAGNVWAFSRPWNEAMLGTAGHNWWAFEFAALWKVAFFFPELEKTRPFKSFFPHYLEQETALSMNRDGYSAEQSVSYHFALADILDSWAIVATLNRLPLSATLQSRLRTMASLSHRLVGPDGFGPGFGDYGAMDMRLRLRESAARYGMGEAKYVAERLDPKGCGLFRGLLANPAALNNVGSDLLPAYRRLKAKAPPLDTALERAGLYVMRQNWSPRSDYMAIEASSKGEIVTSHGHTAIFNLVTYARGTPVLIDSSAGWESDTTGKQWRVGSFAHNVATVDGEHQLPIRSSFRWNQTVQPAVDEWIARPESVYFSGVHEAYERLEHRVSACRRKVFYLRGHYWILIDRFTAASDKDAHAYTQHFQVALPASLDTRNRMMTRGPSGNLMIVPVPMVDPGKTTARLTACPYPLAHYPNPDHLTYTLKTKGSGIMVSLLVPFTHGRMPKVAVRPIPLRTADGRSPTPWEATALEIKIGGRRHVYVDFHMAWNMAWTAGGFSGEGRVFHSAVRS